MFATFRKKFYCYMQDNNLYRNANLVPTMDKQCTRNPGFEIAPRWLCILTTCSQPYNLWATLCQGGSKLVSLPIAVALLQSYNKLGIPVRES